MENGKAASIMANELYVATMKGNVEFFEKIQNEEYLLSKIPEEKNNILHVAVQALQLKFIEAVLRRFPKKKELICGCNSKNNTPLHVAAMAGNLDVVKLLYQHLLANLSDGDGNKKPWMRMTNSEGNTPAHVAIIHCKTEIAKFLLEEDPDLARILNKSEKAPLHLAVINPVKNSKARIQSKLNKTKPTTSLIPEADVIGVIKILVKQAGDVTCLQDTDGFTPLHRAASLSAPYNLQIITFIIQEWPLSTEVCDKSGKSILHLLVSKLPNYKDCKYLLNIEQIRNLRDCQDNQGNTPLHIAAINMDIGMVRALVESGANPDIINMQDIDATSLIEKLEAESMTAEICEAADKGDIAFLKERLSNFGVDFLYSKDSNGQNILHKLFKLPIIKLPKGEEEEVNNDYIAAFNDFGHFVEQVMSSSPEANTRSVVSPLVSQPDLTDAHYDFIKQVMSSSPALVCQTDLNGDTPIHVLVRNNVNYTAKIVIEKRLELCNKFIKEMEEEAASNNEAPTYDPPWVVQNVHGNTPLHQALIAANRWFDNDKVVIKLMEYNKKPIDLCNKRGETLYHLLKEHTCILEVMPPLTGSSPQDVNGFTPLMRAIEGGWEETAILLLNDRSDWWRGRDEKDNTPLHMAIQHHQFDLFSRMLDHLEKNKIIILLFSYKKKNDAGHVPADLIGELDYIPPSLEEQILRNPLLRGLRSAWSIPKSQLQHYMSSVNVIAALLTTITFTAAFTVPGGLDQQKGTPLLLEKNIAFQVFMVSDVIAMCLSMMVLFCLLWIVATDKRNSVMIQDFAITLLLASFVATLLTFMTGVYATISTVKPRIAIGTLVLCSLLMLLVHRFVLTNFIIPFKYVIVHILSYPFRKKIEPSCELQELD